MSGKRAIIRVTADLIRDALAFPETARIVDIEFDFMRPNIFLFKVESPDFQEVEEGQPYPEISPTFTIDYDKKPSTWISCDWNL